jgi:hypothetical protein
MGRRVAFVLFLAAFSGCAQTGMFASGNLTQVQLGQPNYKVVATDVAGSATAGYLLGVSAPMGVTNHTLALARIQGTGQLYREALADLWARFAAANGPIAGRRLALVNVRYDSDNTNLIVYTKPRLTIRADIVEFGE